MRLAEEAEVDELWSYVGKKQEQRWLWHATNHRSGKVLAHVFGRRKDEVFLKLKGLLEPFGITRYDTDYPVPLWLIDTVRLRRFSPAVPCNIPVRCANRRIVVQAAPKRR
jgi:hypothetical protein